MKKRSKSRQGHTKPATVVATSMEQLATLKPALAAASSTESLQAETPTIPSPQRTAITGMASTAITRLRDALTNAGSAEQPDDTSPFEYPFCQEAPALLREQADLRVVAVYESPWEAVLGASEEEIPTFLSEWLRYHSALLRLRHEHPDQLMLVNAKRLDDSAEVLFGALGYSSQTPTTSVENPTGDQRRAADNTTVLARNFDWLAPEYWDVYEALESCAWLGNGEPEYRDSSFSTDSASIAEVTAIWRRATQLPELIRQRDARLEDIERKAASDQSALSEASQQRDELREQQDRLQMQWDETRAELNRQLQESAERTKRDATEVQELQAKCASFENALQVMTNERDALQSTHEQESNAARQREATLQASLLEQKTAAQMREAELQADLRKTTEQAKESAAEADLLLAQLHQVQESLESMFIAGQEAAKQAATTRAQLEKDKATLTEQVKKLQGDAADANKAATAEKAALNDQVKKLQTAAQDTAKSVATEKTALAEQAKKLQGDLTKALESGKAAVEENARLADQTKKLQTELKNAVDATNALKTEKAALTAQVSQVQAEKTAALDRSKKLEVELTAKVNAATAMERDLKSKIDTLEARAKEAANKAAKDAEAQAIQHADKLKAAANEAEKQQALNQAEKAKLAAEAKRLTDELAKAGGKASAAEAELQQRSKAAAEQENKLRETIASLEARTKEAETEAELLLLQLHHVQEELENYFIKSRDATIALEKSTESFNRARRVVTQLVKLRAA